MANEEHIAIFKKGVEVWNKWRKENLDISPDLSEAYLFGANLSGADLVGAHLSRANLTKTVLVETNLENVDLTDCQVYGISVWNIKGKPKEQLNLIITPDDEPKVIVDNLEVAQFVYLLLKNEKIRDVLHTI